MELWHEKENGSLTSAADGQRKKNSYKVTVVSTDRLVLKFSRTISKQAQRYDQTLIVEAPEDLGSKCQKFNPPVGVRLCGVEPYDIIGVSESDIAMYFKPGNVKPATAATAAGVNKRTKFNNGTDYRIDELNRIKWQPMFECRR